MAEDKLRPEEEREEEQVLSEEELEQISGGAEQAQKKEN